MYKLLPLALGLLSVTGCVVYDYDTEPDVVIIHDEIIYNYAPVVLEADAGGLELDLPATTMLDAHPGATYAASVTKVAALAQRRNRRVPIQYFAVTLGLDRTVPEVMKPGLRVHAVLILDELEDVLTVPRQAVFEEHGKKVVYAWRGDRFEPIEVELGPAAPGRIVIESGIEDGDRIALRDPTRPVEGPAEDDPDAETPVVG